MSLSQIFQRLSRRLAQTLVSARLHGLLAGVVAGVVLVGAALFLVTRTLAPGGPVATPAIGSGQAPPVTEAFLRGNQSYDADLVWDAYSDEARQRFTSQGGGLDELRRQLGTARERGHRIEEALYIGGRELHNGTSMHFYLVRLATAQTQGQTEHVPYVFTLDTSGKISRVQ